MSVEAKLDPSAAAAYAMNPREEIISLLRGQVSCPLMSTLGELGWLQRMSAEPFDDGSFGVQVDPAAFRSVMNYLMSLQLVRTEGERFSVTSLGQQIFRRYGAFCIINSYEGYMRELQALLVPDGRVRPTVNRRRNVIGSGALHEKKFFAPALALMGEERPEVAADIGCGDGQFLSSCARRWPGAPLLGVDLSPVAVEESRRRLSLEAPDSSFTGVVANAVDVDTWATLVPEDVLRERRILLSCWFVIHEISERKVSVIVDFFRRVHARCPRATLLIGEVVRVSPEDLAENRTESVLPELTLLHDLSGQGLMSWEEWKRIGTLIPYSKATERQLDIVRGANGEPVPSAFIWKLNPH